MGSQILSRGAVVAVVKTEARRLGMLIDADDGTCCGGREGGAQQVAWSGVFNSGCRILLKPQEYKISKAGCGNASEVGSLGTL